MITLNLARGLRSPRVLLLLAAGMGCGMAGAANAAVSSEVPSLVVHYSEQSLATDGGVQALYRQLLAAAKQVCPADNIRNLAEHATAQQCRQQAIAHAVQQINNPRLAAAHAGRAHSG